MNKYSNLFICLFVLLFCSSCGDLLNQKPESAITNESFGRIKMMQQGS